MARAFTAKAAKDYPQFGIKKGDTYYYWSVGFRGRKQMSLTPPKQSQLCGSKMSEAYAASEDLQEAIDNADSIESLCEAMQDAADRIRSVGEEYQDTFDNLPENFQQSSNAQEMEEKAQGLSDWADSIESDKSDIEGMEASEYADMDIEVDGLDEELIEEEDEQCDDCGGEGKLDTLTPCPQCEGSGEVENDAKEQEECPACEGHGYEREECEKCEGTGQVTKRIRKEVSDFDDLTESEKETMLQAAIEIASNNVDCPL